MDVISGTPYAEATFSRYELACEKYVRNTKEFTVYKNIIPFTLHNNDDGGRESKNSTLQEQGVSNNCVYKLN